MVPPLTHSQLQSMTYQQRQDYRKAYMPVVLAGLSQEHVADIMLQMNHSGIPSKSILAKDHNPSDYLWCLFFRYINVLMVESEICYGMFHSNRAEREIYPHVVIGCELEKRRALGKTKSDLFYLHPALCSALYHTTGLIPPSSDQSVYPKIFSGTCAEDHAAHKVLGKQRLLSIDELKDITFTFPFRPRTMEYVAPCQTCETLFTSYKL